MKQSHLVEHEPRRKVLVHARGVVCCAVAPRRPFPPTSVPQRGKNRLRERSGGVSRKRNATAVPTVGESRRGQRDTRAWEARGRVRTDAVPGERDAAGMRHLHAGKVVEKHAVVRRHQLQAASHSHGVMTLATHCAMTCTHDSVHTMRVWAGADKRGVWQSRTCAALRTNTPQPEPSAISLPVIVTLVFHPTASTPERL